MNAFEQDVERSKALLDYVKQLTTLSTGSILVVAAFVEKIFPSAQWKWLTALSIVGFVASVLGSVVAHTLLIVDFPPRSEYRPDWEQSVAGAALVTAWSGFLAGTISLAIFTTKNLI